MSTPYDRPARPWDLFNANLGRVENEVHKERISICEQCPDFNAVRQCDLCHCFMDAKTKLPNAECPAGKWGQVRVSYKENTNE